MSTLLKLKWNTTVTADDETIFKLAALLKTVKFVDDRPLPYFDGDDLKYKDVYVVDDTPRITVTMNNPNSFMSRDEFDRLMKENDDEVKRREMENAA